MIRPWTMFCSAKITVRCRGIAFAAAALCLIVSPSSAQIAPIPWAPEGYRFLSDSDRATLAPDEIGGIERHNQELLRDSIARMSRSERQKIAESNARITESGDLDGRMRQYITIVGMMLIGQTQREAGQREASIRENQGASVFRGLLERQESVDSFSSEREAVVAEAYRIAAEKGVKDDEARYLEALAPLRARPWNTEIRGTFREIVKAGSLTHIYFPERPTLFDAAMEFLHHRESEAPDEGAWFSLEGVLRLRLRGEVAKAEALFKTAREKRANDVESRLYPLLLAEIEGDAPAMRRLLPSAQEAWPDRESLDEALLAAVEDLPDELQKRARTTFEARYQREHPADWNHRTELLEHDLEGGSVREVEARTGALLNLPPSAIPIQARAEILSLSLSAKARLGKCDEVLQRLPELEAIAPQAFPGSSGTGPPTHQESEIDALRKRASELNRKIAQVKSRVESNDDSSLNEDPDPESLLEEAKELDRILSAGSPALIVRDWNRAERREWERAHKIDELQIYDRASHSDRLVIEVRGDIARCELSRGKFDEAARSVMSCWGAERNLHKACLVPLIDAAIGLVETGRLDRALAILCGLSKHGISADQITKLEEALRRAAPDRSAADLWLSDNCP